MLNLFSKKGKSVLGIDIGSTSIKLIELSMEADGPCILGYGMARLPDKVVDRNVIKDVETLANSVKRLIAEQGFKSKHAVLAVPDSAVISKIVQMNDDLTEQDMEELILIEADKYIPHPVDEINIDFQVLGPSVEEATMLDVLLVASRSENISTRMEAMTRAGLEAKIIDVESFAIERAAQCIEDELPAECSDKIVAIIEVGARYTHLFILQGTKLIFTRQEDGDTVLEPFQDRMLLQIKRSLQFFYSTSHHRFVDHIILAGEMAELPDLSEIIQEQLDILTTIANPFTRMQIDPSVDVEQLYKDAPALMIACGLSLREIG